VRYGESLTEVVAGQTSWRSWLEAAVRAGYVPHQDGIQLAQEAQFLFIRARVREDVEADDPGEAVGWLGIARDYRVLAMRLLTEAEALDAWAAALGDAEGSA
jgi:hypothetical protein